MQVCHPIAIVTPKMRDPGDVLAAMSIGSKPEGGHRLVLPRNVSEESGTIRHDYIETRARAEEVFR